MEREISQLMGDWQSVTTSHHSPPAARRMDIVDGIVIMVRDTGNTVNCLALSFFL